DRVERGLGEILEQVFQAAVAVLRAAEIGFGVEVDVAEDAFELRAACEAAGDLETQDLVIGRIQTHQKTLWMLKSFLKNL
ncbi:MAG: ferritin-like domain-containing protein, partial [Terrimicrobiaceae bacterium]|nr:ferritin-like domain-containing protein [Terrimicrobiaceae bacterium]